MIRYNEKYTPLTPDKQAKIDQELAQATDIIRKYVKEIRQRMVENGGDRQRTYNETTSDIMLTMNPLYAVVAFGQALMIMAEGGYDIDAAQSAPLGEAA